MSNDQIIQSPTAVIRGRVNEQIDSISKSYSREDLEEAFREYNEAGEDDILFRKKHLENICESLKVDMDRLLEDPTLLKGAPDLKTVIEDGLTSMIYDLHKYTPSPSENMARIVRNLAPEYEEDSVRMAILKKFIIGTQLKCKTIYTDDIREWALSRMSSSEKMAFFAASDKRKAEIVIATFDERIFQDLGGKGKLTAKEKLAVIIDKAIKAEDSYTFYDNENNVVKLSDFSFDASKNGELWDVFESFGVLYQKNDSCISIMGNILSIEMPGSKIIEDTIKQFQDILADVYYVQKKGQQGKLSSAWTLFDNALKDAAKTNRNGELIELCNDFAEGVFRTNNGDTRRKLFWFAMVFGMTVRLRETDPFIENKDIEKNLFEDYYSDNLMRFLSEDFAKQETMSMFENEPTGEGINYKNYVESIYVYYLYRKEMNLIPGERIDSAEKMIDRCLRSMKKVREYSHAAEIINTPGLWKYEEWETARKTFLKYISNAMGKYRELADHKAQVGEPDALMTEVFKDKFAGIIAEIPEKSLARFVCRNFRILPSIQISSDATPKIQISAGERKAFKVLNSILDSIYDQYAVYSFHDDVEEQDGTFEQDLYPMIDSLTSDLGNLLRKKYEDEQEFLRMINQIELRFRFEAETAGSIRSRILALLLDTFYRNLNKKFTNEDLKKKLNKYVSVNGNSINHAIRILQSLGYNIHTASVEESKTRINWMDQEYYKDERLQTVLDVIVHKKPNDSDSIKAVEKLILIKNPKECRVTRSRLVAAKAIDYILQNDGDDNMDIPYHYEKFITDLNESLQGTRYQKFNEKNIFDLYVAASICICLVKQHI